MHRRVTHRIFALTMAFLVMVSSSGIAMDVHYCMGQLKNINLFGEAENCHDSKVSEKLTHCEKVKKQCHNANKTSVDKQSEKGCCNNQLIEFQNDADLIPIISATFFTSDITFLYSPCIWGELKNKSIHNPQEYLIYKPPNRVQDIPILIQSFLI